MSEEIDRLGVRAARALREVAARTSDPDADLAAVYSAGGSPASRGETSGRRWLLAAAAVFVVVAAAVAVIAVGGDDQTQLVPATAPSVPVTSSPPVTTAGTVTTPPSTTTPPTTVGPPTTAPSAGRTSPLDVYAGCGPDCPDVGYGGDGVPVAYDPAGRTLTVLESTPRSFALDLPETSGRLVAVGPDGVAYLVVASTEEPSPGRLVAVPTRGGGAGSAVELLGPVDGLDLVGVGPAAGGIAVVDCCGVDVPDTLVPYVDGTGAPLPADASMTSWSWTWTGDRITVREFATGREFEVPQPQADREGPRAGDLRPLLDGRVVVFVDDAAGAQTAWVLDPRSGTWTSTALGDASAWDVDPTGAVLTRDRSTQAYGLVPLA